MLKLKIVALLLVLSCTSVARAVVLEWQYNVYQDLHGKFATKAECDASLEAAMAQKGIAKPWPNGVQCDPFTVFHTIWYPKANPKVRNKFTALEFPTKEACDDAVKAAGEPIKCGSMKVPVQ